MDHQVLGAVLGALGMLASVGLAFMKIKSSFKKEVDEEIASAVATARTIAEGDLRALDVKVDGITKDIQNLEKKMDVDIAHVKMIYNSELKVLSEKIESLRDDVQKQHQQLVEILTKLIINK